MYIEKFWNGFLFCACALLKYFQDYLCFNCYAIFWFQHFCFYISETPKKEAFEEEVAKKEAFEEEATKKEVA